MSIIGCALLPAVLAHQAQAASLVTAPHPDYAYFKHLELISTHGRQVLMVMVLSGGEVSQQMLNLAEPVSQEQLSYVAQSINEICQGLSSDQIAALGEAETALEVDIRKLVMGEMKRSTAVVAGELYRDGLTHVLAEPEFGEVDLVGRALRLLEERPLLEDLLARTVLSSDLGGYRCSLAERGPGKNFAIPRSFWHVMVLLDWQPEPSGVLGPMRMPYGRTISTVRFMAGLLSNMVEDMLTAE